MRTALIALAMLHLTMTNGDPVDISVSMYVASHKPLNGVWAGGCRTLVYTLGPSFCVTETREQVMEQLK